MPSDRKQGYASHSAERRITMKKFVQGVITVWAMIVLTTGLSGCTKEGPVEKAGKKIDQTVEKVGEHIEQAGEKVQDVAEGIKK
jgi:hypothetical protein